jgi:hypothetical protein
MALNPYQPVANSNAGIPGGQTPLGPACITGLTLSVLPAMNEASIFWGHTQWLFWDHSEMFPLSVKLWIIGMVVSLALFGFLTSVGFDTKIPWKMSVIVMSLSAIEFLLCASWNTNRLTTICMFGLL